MADTKIIIGCVLKRISDGVVAVCFNVSPFNSLDTFREFKDLGAENLMTGPWV
jgi:hypothetical protein